MNDAHLWRGFLEIDAELAKEGVPRSHDPWLIDIERCYTHATALRWTAHPGRGAGKNLVGIKCDLTELIFGRFVIPSGETHYHVNISENRTEAEKTLKQMAAYLRMLDVEHTATADTIELHGELQGRGVKVLACRIGAVSGFRSTGLTVQECAKWMVDGSNPTREVITSALAQTVTHPNARKRFFSTPMGTKGWFYEQIARGETNDQIVTSGPSWKFNPTISEAATRELEPHEATWRREYCGEPQAGAAMALDVEALRSCVHDLGDVSYRETEIFIDSQGGKNDNFVIAAFAYTQSDPRLLVLRELTSISGEATRELSTEDVNDQIARMARKYSARRVRGDQYGAWSWASGLRTRGLKFVEHPWSAGSKVKAMIRLRQLIRERRLVVLSSLGIEADALISEASTFEEKILPSGVLSFGGRGKSKDDRIATLLLAARVDADGGLSGSPTGRTNMGEAMMRAAARERGELVNDAEPELERADIEELEREAGIRRPADLSALGVRDSYFDTINSNFKKR